MFICRVVLAMVTLTALGAMRALANPPIPLPITVGINFAESFATVACPAGSPATAFCLNVTGTANVAELGPVSFQRSVFIPDTTLYNPNYPTCIPDDSAGTLTFRNGTLTFHAIGNICLLDKSASYGLIVTGGTGAYTGVIASGQITALPPQTASTARELWRLDLFPPSSAE